MARMYTFRDFATGVIKRTRGKFVGWTKPTGPLCTRYAIFRNQASDNCVPMYCLTADTLKRITGLAYIEEAM